MSKINNFYTATTDAIFKAIFCNPDNEHLLKTLLEKSINKKIDEIKIQNPESNKNNVYLKGCVSFYD